MSPQFICETSLKQTEIIAAEAAGLLRFFRTDSSGRRWYEQRPDIHGVPKAPHIGAITAADLVDQGLTADLDEPAEMIECGDDAELMCGIDRNANVSWSFSPGVQLGKIHAEQADVAEPDFLDEYPDLDAHGVGFNDIPFPFEGAAE